jgi:TolB-like protein/Tfp pilus assembly protein PilF
MLVFDRYVARRPSETAAARASSAAVEQPRARGGIASIAVLPFVNMSDDRANDYFSDGLTEELLNVLAKVQGLRVIARTSSFAFKGKEMTIADIAKALDVQHVLEGSVRKSGDRVRITAQLIRAADSSHLWSETYDRTLQDVFAIQDEISGEVVDALKVRLLGEEAVASPEVGGTSNPQAYEAYLQGLYDLNKGQRESTLRSAIEAFDRAIALDQGYARANVGRARALSLLTSNGSLPFDTGFEQARVAAQEAVRLEPRLAEGWTQLGFVAVTVDFDVDAARGHFERALSLEPGNAEVQGAYAAFALGTGRVEDGIAAATKAVQLDPLSARQNSNLAGAYYLARRFPESLDTARRVLRLDPNFPGAHAGIGFALLETGALEEARAEFERESGEWQGLTGIALADAKLGRTDRARVELEEFVGRFGEAASYQYAQINAQLGDTDEAFRWLEVARRVRDPGLGQLLLDPLMDPLRSDRRFDRLVEALNLPGSGPVG